MVSTLRNLGFTLIELLVVMAIIATLLSVTVPRYFHSVDKSREAVLREDLRVMRDAIDKYFSDHTKYPDTLEDLVAEKYLRNVPQDPLTDSNQTWIAIAPEDLSKGHVANVISGAKGIPLDESSFANW